MAIKIPIVTVFDSKGLQNAQTAIGKVGDGIRGAFRVAAGATAAVAALTTVGVAFAKAGEQAATSNARISQIAESMGLFGSEAGVVSERLQDLAKQTALQTGMDINSIKTTQAKLLTFRELAATADEAGGSFDRATTAALDLAAAGFGEAETNAVQLGKALQDPIKGITALARSGVTFTEQEKEKIAVMVQSGDILTAQGLILTAIETQVGGTAIATANATDKMAQAFQIMKEDVGTAVLPLFEQITTLISTALTPLATALTPIFTTLFAALIPIVENALPVFVEILESLTPIFETLLNAMQPLLDALSPLVDTFMLVAQALAPLIEQAMPILVKLVEILTPVISQLIEALIPLVEKLMPPLLKLFEALIPILEIIIDYFLTYLLPVFVKLIEMALPPLISLIEGLTAGIEWLNDFLGPLYDLLKPVLDGLLAIAGIKPGELKKEIEITTSMDAETRRMMNLQGSQSGGMDAELRRMLNLRPGQSTAGTPAPIIVAAGGLGGGPGGGINAAAQAQIAEAVRIAEEARRVAEEARRKEQEILDKRKAAFESFNNAVKSLFGQIKESILSSFNLPTLGNSVNSITRNIGKLLERTKSFAKNISQLSGMGLNSALLQQVIQAGPMAGSQLASAIVGGGSSFVGQLNQAFGEMGLLASGIAGVGTGRAFENPSIANTYNIEVNGGVGSGPSIGKAIVDAIKSYERTSGAVWQGA